MVRATVLAAAWPCPAPAPTEPPTGPRGRGERVTIFYTAEIHGTLEPCGCTSDPLGDIARYAALVRRRGAGLPCCWSTPVGLSFPESSTPEGTGSRTTARATFLGEALAKHRPAVRRRAGRDRHRRAGRGGRAARLAANVAPSNELDDRAEGEGPALAPSRVNVGGVRVGILGVADPGARRPASASPPRIRWPPPSAKRRRFVAKGAELVIALAADRQAAGAADRAGRGRRSRGARAPGRPRAWSAPSRSATPTWSRPPTSCSGSAASTSSGGERARSSTAAARRRPRCAGWRSTGRSRGSTRSSKAWATAARRRSGLHRRARKRERDALLAERRRLDAPWQAPGAATSRTA